MPVLHLQISNFFPQENKNNREGNLHHLLKYLRIFSPLAPSDWFLQRFWFSWGRILLPIQTGSFHTGMSARQFSFCSGTWCNDDITSVHGCFTSAFNQGPGRTISSLHGIWSFPPSIQVDWHVLYWLEMFEATLQPKLKIQSSFTHVHNPSLCSPWNTKGRFLMNIFATLFNLMKVNDDWDCQTSKRTQKGHKSTIKVSYDSYIPSHTIVLCGEQTEM